MGKDVVEKALKVIDDWVDETLMRVKEKRYAEGEIGKNRLIMVWLTLEDKWSFLKKHEIMVSVYGRSRVERRKFISMASVGGVKFIKFRKKEKANQYFDELVKKYKLKEKRTL